MDCTSNATDLLCQLDSIRRVFYAFAHYFCRVALLEAFHVLRQLTYAGESVSVVVAGEVLLVAKWIEVLE